MKTSDSLSTAVIEGEHQRSRGADQRVEFTQIATAYYGRLVSYLRRNSCSKEDAADIAQDAFARLWAADLAHIEHRVPFLYKTALNLLRDRARSRSSRIVETSVSTDQIESSAVQQDRILYGKQQLAILESALNELSPKRRAALVLYRFDGLSHRQIADALGISVSMVEKHVRLALEHCRHRLQMADDEKGMGSWIR